MDLKQMADPDERGIRAESKRSQDHQGRRWERGSRGEGGSEGGGCSGDLASVAVPAIHSFIRPMLSPMGLTIFRQLRDQAQTNGNRAHDVMIINL